MNRHNPDWLELRKKIAKAIEDDRDRLEQPGLDPEFTRGRIDAMRAIIQMVEPAAPFSTEIATVDYNQSYEPSET
jgi:hypothetical protein